MTAIFPKKFLSVSCLLQTLSVFWFAKATVPPPLTEADKTRKTCRSFDIDRLFFASLHCWSVLMGQIRQMSKMVHLQLIIEAKSIFCTMLYCLSILLPCSYICSWTFNLNVLVHWLISVGWACTFKIADFVKLARSNSRDDIGREMFTAFSPQHPSK